MIPTVPDRIIQYFVNCVNSDEDFERKNVVESESIMDTGVYLMEAAILRTKGTSTIGIRQVTIDKRLKDECELKAMKSVANDKEMKTIHSLKKRVVLLNRILHLFYFLFWFHSFLV